MYRTLREKEFRMLAKTLEIDKSAFSLDPEISALDRRQVVDLMDYRRRRRAVDRKRPLDPRN
jgi:hypothetical protein